MARGLAAENASSDAPAQQSRSGVGTLTEIVVARVTGGAGASRGGMEEVEGECIGLNSGTTVPVRDLVA